jgi:tetratricopeptide (TPR) repeat protein
MQQQPPRGGSGQLAGVFLFEAKIENEEPLVDAILGSMARAALPADAWDRLHAAARRDGRLSEVAFALEAVSQGKRLRASQPGVAAEFLFQAARFFGDVFGDDLGSLTYLERALSLAPTHAGAFARLEAILLKTQQTKKLAEAYATAAQHKPRAEQAEHLRRASNLLGEVGGSDERVIDLLQSLLRLEPGDEEARLRLEALYVRANRFRDVIRLNDQALAAEPGPDDEARARLLARIVEIYADRLQEPERALPHVEQLLAIDPAHEGARRVAQKLVVTRGLAGRAAAALATAFEAAGTPQEVARYLTIELENTRGPKRATVLARLASVKSERLADDTGAFDALEQALAIDSTDDGLRGRYVELATKLERYVDAARTLGRVVATVKEPAVKARMSAQLGEMLLRGGDAKRARAMLAGVLATPDATPDAVLTAAYALAEILRTEKDPRPLCDVLEHVARLEPDTAKRRDADLQVADLATRMKDTPRAVAAYERLLDTDARARALEALAPLYEATGDPDKLARLLELRGADETDPTQARDLMMRAAKVRASETKDAPAAIAACHRVVERFGAARDVLALAIPLLEGQRLWQDLADALAQDASLASGSEQAEILGRLGTIRMLRLRDVRGALDAFEEALAFDPHERVARTTLEKLASATHAGGDHRVEAGAVLEPIYRREGARAPLSKVLEARGSLARDLDTRLEALREAAGLAVDPARSLDLLGRGLAEAVAGERPLAEWLDGIDAIGTTAADPKRRASLLGEAIGDREVTSEELCTLATRAADGLAATGDAQTALALYRRALAFDPRSTELLSRVDDLLRDRGSPRERIALYRAALARGAPEQRRGLIHRIGTIEWRDLNDLPAAIATYRAALEGDADDLEAQAALEELFARAELWDDLSLLLEERLARAGGDASRTLRSKLAQLAANRGDEERARAQSARLLEDPQLLPDHLDAMERVADKLDDVDLAHAVLRRRAEIASDPREQIGWLEKLGELDRTRRGDLEGAAAVWKRAAAIGEAAGDDENARRLFAMARAIAPGDAQVTARLVALYERAELWSELPPLYAELGKACATDAERVELALRTAQVLSDHLHDVEGAARSAGEALELLPTRQDTLETFVRLSFAAGSTGQLEKTLDGILSQTEAARRVEGDARALVLLARARAIATDPARIEDAAGVYRAILDEVRIDRAHHATALAAFDALIAGDPEAPSRLSDRRWLLEWRAERAPDDERVPRLIEWARQEETTFADPLRALALYRRIVGIDAECDEALSAVGRLALTTGETEDALAALRARRERASGQARVAIDLETAHVLLTRTARPEEALATLRAVLVDAPGEPAALSLAVQLLSHRPTRAETIALFEHALESADDPEARVDILTRLIDAPAAVEDAEARRGWFERLCDLYRERGAEDAALAIAVRAARELPDVGALWDRAEELARAVSSADDVAALYEDVLARTLSREQALSIGERAVKFYEEWFEDPARVVTILERVLQVDPTADWAFDRLKLVLDSAERWDDLFTLYDRALESATGKKRAALLEDAAQTAKDFADRPDRAIEYLEQLQELKPGDAKLAGALERLYERQGRHRELVTLLTARLPTFKPDEGRRARVRVATLWLDELGDPAAALESIAPLIEPPDKQAKKDGGPRVEAEVWSLLERVVAASPPPQDSRRSAIPSRSEGAPRSKRGRGSEALAAGSVRQRAAVWLRGHYAGSGRDADLARMLLIELETVRTAKERIRRHTEVAELYEKLGDLVNALEQTGLSVILAPDDAARRGKLEVLAERTGRLDRLADILATAADSVDGQPLRVALTMQAAAVRADRVGDAAGAIALLGSILEAPSAAKEDVLTAARRLEPLLEATGRVEARLDVIEKIATLERDGQARRPALGQAAGLAAQLGQNARGISLWERCLTEDAHDIEALDGLVDLLERVGQNDRLVEVLGLRAAASTSASPERRRTDRVRVAKLLADVLGRRDDAIDAWRAIERDFGETEDAAGALTGLLREAKRWPELAALLRRRVGRTEEATVRAELLRQLGDVQRDQLGTGEVSVATYAEALAADPRNAGARDGLHVLSADGAHRAAAVGVLLGAMRECDDWQGVLELTAHRLVAATSDDAKLAILLEAADISERRAGDSGLAFEAIRRAFAIAPADERVAREIERLAAEARAWSGLVEAYGEAIEAGAEASVALRLWRKIGETLETHLDDARGALAAYQHVLAGVADVDVGAAAVRVAGSLRKWDVAAKVVVDLASVHGVLPVGVQSQLEQTAGAAGAWDDVTRALAGAAAASELRGLAARDVYARVAELHRDRRADPEQSQAAFQRALEHDAANAGLLAALARLQRATGGRPLIDTLTRLSRASGGDFALLQEAAEVASGAVGDRALARAIATELLELARTAWPADADRAGDDDGRGEPRVFAEWAIELLARLHGEDGDQKAVLEVLTVGEALPFEPSVRRSMRRRAARIALDDLGDHERAVSLYLSLFADDRHDAEAIDRLAATYVTHGRTRDLLSLREQQIEATAEPQRRLELRLEAAGLLSTLEEPERAADVLRANLGDVARHEDTVEALSKLLDAGGLSTKLRDLLAEQAELAQNAGDATRAAELWSRAATLAEQRLSDRDAAAKFHERVVALEPRVASFDALARLAVERSDQVAAAGWLERLVATAEPPERTAAGQRLGEALVAAGQSERAAERLEELLQADPEAEPLRVRLGALYREKGSWAKLARLVAGAAVHAPDKATRMARLLEAARLFSERCNEPESAVPLLEQASDIAPHDQSVRLGLADALANARRFDDARAILQAMIDAFAGRRPKERAPVHHQMARLELAMGNRARALVELDAAARIDPQEPETLRALARLAQEDGQLERAEKSYRALLAVLRRREDGKSPPKIARSEVLLELSTIAERHGEGDRSREILESAVEAAAQSDFEQERLEIALRARGSNESLVRVLELRLARTVDPTEAARVLAELADVFSERLGRPEEALAVRLRAVALDPSSDGTHQAALTLARSLGAVARYVEGAAALVEPATDAGDVALGCALLMRLGEVAETDLRDDGRAGAFYERAVELGARTPVLLRKLDGVYERLGDLEKQARVLGLCIEAGALEGGPKAASEALYRLATLRLASPQTLDDGAELLQEALDLDPQLERATEALRKAVTIDPARGRLLDLYERVGRNPGHERALVEALRLRAQLQGADVAIVREAVEVATRIDDAALAESMLERFIESEGSGAQPASLSWALENLANLRAASGDLARAVALKRRAAQISEPDVARRLAFEVARLAADKLDDLALAAETYEGLWVSDRADREAWEPLADVLRRLGDARKLVEFLGSAVDYVDDPRERARLRLERVRAMVASLGLEEAQAAPLLREILEEDPSQMDAALMLAGVLQRTGAREDLAALLASQIDAAKDRSEVEAIAALTLRLGPLLEETDPPQARGVYYTALDWAPDNRELLDALVRTLGSDDDLAERLDLMERRLAVEKGPEAEAMALALSVARTDLGDDVAAERALEIGYRGHPASEALRARLEAAYRRRSEWQKLAELCVVDGRAREDAGERVARLREAALIWQNELRDARSAASTLRLAREAAPEDSALLVEHVEALVEAGDRDAAIVELGSAIDALPAEDAARAPLLSRRAAIRQTTGDELGALEDLEAAFALDRKANAAALTERLEGALQAAESIGDWAAARILKLRQAHVLPYTGGVDRARTILGELVNQDPKDREALDTLASLEVALERWDAASAALRKLVLVQEGDGVVETALRLADACERAGRPGDARGALERVRLVLPQDPSVRQQLERLYELTGAWRELSEVALEDARASGDVAERFFLLLRAGSLLLERAGDPEGAVTALQEARALRPKDPDCIGLLADALTVSGRAPEALTLVDQLLGPSKGRRVRELAGLYWRLARISRTVSDAAGEVRALGQALECDAQNGQVCADVAVRAMEVGQLELATRALRAVTLLKTPSPMSKALAYQYMGEVARAQGDPKRALTLIKRALVEDPALDSAKVLLADVAVEAG